MDLLTTAIETSRLGRGQARIIEGQPGIGKTRLVEEAGAWAGQRDIQVFWGRCYEGDGAPAFWPWREILQAMVSDRDAGELRRSLGKAADDLGAVVPELTAPAQRQTQEDSPDLRFRLFESVTQLIALVARDIPAVLVLEDLHGADPSSLLLLEFAARSLRQIPVTLLATTRPALGENAAKVRQTLHEVMREPHAEHLTLGALPDTVIAELIESTLGFPPPLALVAELRQRSEGNPFFLREYLRLLRDDRRATEPWNRDAVERLPVPETVQSVITQRLGLLSPSCRRFLAVASVYGREFDAAAVHHAMRARVDGEGGAEAMDLVVTEAIGARIVTPSLERSNHYRFSHTLIREILYDGMDPPRRLLFHRHIVATLAVAGRDQDLSLLAFHCLKAVRDATASSESRANEDTEKAIHYLRRAATYAMRLRAYDEAVRLQGQALALFQAPEESATACEIRIELGRALNAAGDAEASKEILSAAADQASRLGLSKALVDTALEYGTKFVWGEGPTPDTRLIEILEAALRLRTEANDATRARLMARLAVALRFSNRDEEREALATQALTMARRHGDARGILDALHSSHAACWHPNNLRERFALSGEMVRLANQIGDLEGSFKAHAWRFDNFLERGDLGAVVAEAKLCQSIAGELGQPFYRLLAEGMWIALRVMQGDRREAETRIAVLATEAAGHEPRGHALITGWMFNASITGGRRAALESLALPLDLLAGQFPDWPPYRSARAHVAHELGEATDLTRTLRELYATHPRSHTAWFLVAAHLATTCASVEDRDLARRLVADLEPYEDRAVTIVSGGGYFGAVAHFLAMLETILQDWPNAERHFALAAEMNRRLQAHPWLARTQIEHARMLWARNGGGDRERAGELLNHAAATADRLEMDLLREQIAHLRARAMRVSGPRPASRALSEAGAHHLLDLEGDTWAFHYADRIVHLKDSRGLRYLAVLLAHPYRSLHVLDLIALADHGKPGKREDTPPPGMSWRALGATPPEPIFDATARRSIEARIAALTKSMAALDRRGASEEARAQGAELDALRSQLAAATDLGGRPRRLIDEVERARIAVTKRIKDAIKRAHLHHPELAHHLATTIRTGSTCSYLPGYDEPSWIVRHPLGV